MHWWLKQEAPTSISRSSSPFLLIKKIKRIKDALD
nr:MAG TPA: hypothetical protein [Caudoviricetes sp.]